LEFITMCFALLENWPTYISGGHKKVFNDHKAFFPHIINRVARWFVFKPKIPNFGGSCYGKSWYILWPFDLFYGHWKYFKAIWYILWYIFPSFGILDHGKSGNPATMEKTRHSVTWSQSYDF
jgi:hypothetical protein